MDRPMTAEEWTERGKTQRNTGDSTAAAASYLQAADLLRSANQPLRLARTIRHVADILREAGHFTPALPHYQEALSIYRSDPATPPLDLANTLRGYALLAEHLGDLPQSVSFWQEARSFYVACAVQPGADEAEHCIKKLS